MLAERHALYSRAFLGLMGVAAMATFGCQPTNVGALATDAVATGGDPSVVSRFGALVHPGPGLPGAEAERIALGRMLFFDKRLSRSGELACNSCHQLDRFGVDGLPVSVGHLGRTGRRNAPTVYNTSGHVAQFWDGRAETLEEQAKGPILNRLEMAMPGGDAVVRAL